ncbi:GtrA family protein [Novosphingobium guangzhouense]|uniref:Glycosyltransferase RgtA/B/C/D-like domain-containing protein n=1 Tax=Novosphingobium guangzhouense TaxID=1850347 RepID=A0A2K2FZJ6_9SPHN|nr:GtrA family protein [Novosphingobium guangzhouense]PNU04210.1 hypothetical protein A8V01_21430 [Novosphingobium guangzhouense]
MTAVSGTIPLRWCAALVVLAAVPLFWPLVPPLIDLPAHMSRYMVQMDGGRSADLAQWYGFRWNLLPNLGADLLAWLLEPVIGLRAAVKAMAILIVMLQVAGYLLLSRAAHGRVAVTALFAVPLALGNPFQFGFLNFTLGMALATLALAWWISPSMAEQPRRRWLVFCLVACVVWICHLAAWATLCVLVGCCELALRFERTGRLWPALWGGFLASSCLLVPQVASLAWPHPTGHLPTEGWLRMGVKLYHLINVLADRWEAWDYACAALLAALVVTFWRSSRFALHKGLALGALALLGLFMVMPGTIYGSAYADMRLTPTIYALALICACPADLGAGRRRVLLVAALVFLALRLVGNTVSMAAWDAQIRKEQAVVEHVPRGSQLLTFIALPCGNFIRQQARQRDVHIASYAMIRRHAFANDQWAMPGGQLLTIHNPAAGPFLDADIGLLVAEQCQGTNQFLAAMDRVPAGIAQLWVVWHAPELRLDGWRPVARSGGSVLYRRQMP